MVLNTILYQGNYNDILNHSSWFLNYQSSEISSKLITVNNVIDRKQIEHELCQYKKNYNFDFFFVEDYEEEAKSYFNVEIDNSFTKGYYYIIPYFALIYKMNTGFFFNVSSDCSNDIYFDDNFLIESKKQIEKNEKILITTLNWGYPRQSFGYDLGEWEQLESFRYKNKTEKDVDNFWYSLGFTDQVFIASADRLKEINYNLETSNNPIYHGPWYCPNSWEKRIAEFMFENEMYRGVWKNSEHYYIHPGHKM